MQKKKDLILPIYVVINVFIVLLSSYLSIKSIINMWKMSRLYILLSIINIIVLIIMFIINKIQKRKISFKITDVFLLLIVFFGFISSCFAINKESAFFGFIGRYEGFLEIMYYLSIFLLATFIDKKYKKYIVYSIIFSGLIECIYAILQVKAWFPIYIQYNHGSPWATGFITNPNFFGTFMLLCLSYSIALFIDSKEKVYKFFFGLLLSVFMIGLLISNTLSVFVGLFAVYVYVVIYLIKNKKYYDLIIITVLLALITVLVHYTGDSYVFKDIIKTNNQVVEMSKGHIEDTYGSKRVFIWRKTIKEVPKHLIHGVGIDNFYYAFENGPIGMYNWFFDKAHNEYLQILICEGIFALISYLLFFGFISFNGIKYSFKNKELFLILPIIGYLVQAFFNISVIEVAPFFYIALGLCVDRGSYKERK